MDMVHLEGLEEPQDLDVLAFAGFPIRASSSRRSVANSWGSSQPCSGAA